MNADEIRLFHKNYEYMWNKLSTSYYQVKRQMDKSNRVVGGSILPAYSICSKCKNDPDYIPSSNAINSIVQFYNMNLTPEVNSYQFLHEDLSLTDETRYRSSTLFDWRFISTYYGYYPSVSLDGMIAGACLKIFEEDGLLKAVLVTGIRSDTEMRSTALQTLFLKTSPQYSHFKEYYQSRSPENQRCSFYKGTVEVSTSSLLVSLRSQDEDARKLILVFNVECFPIKLRRPYMGGLAFALTTSDGPFDARFYKLGFINTDTGYISLANMDMANILSIENHPLSIQLTSGHDRVWYEFILKNLDNKQTR